jgi:two-component system, NtrC family, response regulator AtoC
MIRILFIDDDSKAHRILRTVLPREYHLISSYRGSHGIEAAKREIPDLVLLDIDLPDTDGIDVLKILTRLPTAPPVIMLTALAQISLVVRAMRFGAADYLVKPYELASLTNAIKTHAIDSVRATDACVENPVLSELVGASPPMLAAKQLLLRYAQSGGPVLITGESGTGKELAARIVHRLSDRATGPFVPRNCAAIPATLFETEVFGSERGAFTDAVSRPGSFERAGGGSLFLDEIGEIPAPVQAKLLRVLETGEVSRLGASRQVQTDVRIITATNTKLADAIAAGRFRSDLFYRISMLPVTLPPLRDRIDDLPLLIASLFASVDSKITRSARDKLCGHPWPGNVRELKNVLGRAALLAGEGEIGEQYIGFPADI